jgi:hypothetical protein
MPDNGRVDPHGLSENPRLRASDADRDRAASVINAAMAEGRLTADEHSERLDAIYSAKTHADIVPILDDLPSHEVAAVPRTTGDVSVPAQRGGWIVAILAGASRKGIWRPAPDTSIITVLGGAEIDFRDAVLPGREITIRAVCVLGGLDITVPPEMRVVDSSVAILGGTDVAGDTDESAAPDAPVLRITGACVLGGISVSRKDRKTGKGKNKLKSKDRPRTIGN